jgi:hypothetical protein
LTSCARGVKNYLVRYGLRESLRSSWLGQQFEVLGSPVDEMASLVSWAEIYENIPVRYATRVLNGAPLPVPGRVMTTSHPHLISFGKRGSRVRRCPFGRKIILEIMNDSIHLPKEFSSP